MTTKTMAPSRLELTPVWGGCALAGWLCLAVGAQAQASTSGEGSRLRFQLSSTLTVSDQIGRGAEATNDRGALLSVRPSLLWQSRAGLVRGTVDFGLTGQEAIRTELQQSRQQNHLRATLNSGMGTRWLDLSLQAQVGQQAQSAFGAQGLGSSGSLARANQKEVGSVVFTPRIDLGRGSDIGLEASHTLNAQQTRASTQGDQHGHVSNITLRGPEVARLQWRLTAQQQVAKPKAQRSTESDQAALELRGKVNSEWALRGTVGAGRSNLVQLDGERTTTYGGGLRWQPGPRTHVELDAGKSVVADQFNFKAQHRWARLAINALVSQSESQGGVLGSAGQQTRYDLLFQQYASQEPDPVLRDALVRQELARLGLSADAPAAAGFISSGPTLTRRGQLAFNWDLARWSLSGNGSWSRSFRLGSEARSDDLAQSSFVLQRGLGFNLAYRLNPKDSLNAYANWQRTQGDRAELANSLKSAGLAWTTRLGPRNQINLSLRRSEFRATLRPYTENAFLGTLTQQF
ncbi:uncharacterized protein (PEP-CTERM system associated) [Inhella inkyongensis]|uniref:Uncharacterized protein (PEP-CTERM system associated) n=1 Tax=Inhella inkyongensis TaxID=392593 RepID=A0A840S660_9BURK|nr:TIGR03016 family PEP-CTERM system-associated outer membrane protein [Inhella inkyongensis]MBB5203969.1 uncharacterized protein (PEP-CTERM system associated) [Inhella inkyongensis]